MGLFSQSTRVPRSIVVHPVKIIHIRLKIVLLFTAYGIYAPLSLCYNDIRNRISIYSLLNELRCHPLTKRMIGSTLMKRAMIELVIGALCIFFGVWYATQLLTIAALYTVSLVGVAGLITLIYNYIKR